MKTKTLLISIALFLAVMLSACGAPAAMTPATQQPSVRTLNVNGVGQISLKPDIAYINVGVHSEAASAAEAVAANTADSQQVISAIKAAGVAEEDIRTTNFSIWPNPQIDPNTGKQIGSTYIVENTVYVTVRDLAKLGDLLDAAVKAGANSINSISFDLKDKTQALAQAREAAVASAKAQAEQLAAAAGVTLGAVQSISYYDSVPVPVMGKGMGGASMDMAAAVPINPGSMDITANVSMTYEIK